VRLSTPRRNLPVVGALGPRSSTALILFLGSALTAAIAFGGSVLTARLLGPAGKGELTAWTVVAFCATLLLVAPVPTGLGRAYLNGERRALLPTALAHAAVALGLVVIMAGIGVLAQLDIAALICFLVICPAAGVLALDLQAVAQAAKQPWVYNATAMAAPAVFTGGIAFVAVADVGDVELAAYALFALGALVSAFTAAMTALRLYGTRAATMLRASLRLGRGSYTVRLVDFLILRLDQFLVVGFLSTSSLGIYSVAVNWAEVALYAGTAIGLSLFEDESTLDQAAARRVIKLSAWILSGIAVAVAATGFILISPLFGPAFAEARGILLLLAPGVVARGLAIGASQILLARGRGVQVGRLMAVVLFIAAALMLALIPLLGIEGAAIASSVSYAVQMVLVLRQLARSGTPTSRAPEPTPVVS
jgi:O-antigen/teichoic acid export membrane protein